MRLHAYAYGVVSQHNSGYLDRYFLDYISDLHATCINPLFSAGFHGVVAASTKSESIGWTVFGFLYKKPNIY